MIAVSGSSTWTPKGAREGRHPVVLGRCTPPPAYVRTLEDSIPESWEHVHYTRA